MPLSSRNAFGSKRVRSAVDAESLYTTPSTISPDPTPDASPVPTEPPPGPADALPSGRSDPPGADAPAPPDPDDPAPPGPFALATRSERSTPVVPRTT